MTCGANEPVQRMAAGGRLPRVRVPGAAAIADFNRYIQHRQTYVR